MAKKFEKNEKLLLQIISDDPSNQICADCGAKSKYKTSLKSAT